MALVVFQLNMYVLCKHESANYASCIGIPSLYEDFTQGPNLNYQLLTLKLDFLKIGICILVRFLVLVTTMVTKVDHGN